MVIRRKFLFLTLIFLLLGACASRMRDQMKAYREAFASGDLKAAEALLEKSDLKKDKKSALLWHLEKGTLTLHAGRLDEAIQHFQESLSLIDLLYTKKLTAKAASLLVNDSTEPFYGSSYERSYAHYFQSKAYYLRYLKSGNKLDLQASRATILAWDSYFQELQRSSTYKTVYQTDLMLKVFGGEIHEVSQIRADKQIALQLYKDALKILKGMGGVYSVFNKKNTDFVKAYVAALKDEKSPPTKHLEPTPAYDDLKDFLHYKVLSLTKDIRTSDYDREVKDLKPTAEVLKKIQNGPANVVIVMEEGFIPPKVPKPFNFGLKGAMDLAGDSKTRQMIVSVGAAAIATFAMNTLDMVPTQNTSAGTFAFGYEVTKLAATEAAVEFELPMIEDVPLVQRLELFILNDKGVVVERGPLPIVSENGDIARVVLEEDAVARYVKTGARVALKHLVAIMAAYGVYQKFKTGKDSNDFLAKTAAVATYVGASKGLSALEKADTRHWTTLPQALRLTEFKLPPGKYKLAVGLYSGTKAPDAPAKLLQDIEVKDSSKSLHTVSFAL